LKQVNRFYGQQKGLVTGFAADPALPIQGKIKQGLLPFKAAPVFI
jgi:hypothetical protein